ncbi:MAG: VWA domain-containing protein [Candidatus Acidiferrales bacterium]
MTSTETLAVPARTPTNSLAFTALQKLIAIASLFCLGVAAPLLVIAQAPQHKSKSPRPMQLDANVTFRRDANSGELHIVEPGPTPNEAKEKGAARAFRVRVNLVPVNCNVFAPDGTSITGLGRANFRIFEGGVEQRIAYFDAGNEPASVAAVIDASPSVLPEADAMLRATKSLAELLAPRDEVSIVEFSAHSYVLLPFSRDRDLLENAIARVDVKALFGDTGGSDIYETVYLAAEKLFRGRTGRKAILLFTDGEDSGLGLSLDRPTGAAPNEAAPTIAFDDVTRALAVDGIEVFAVSTQNRPRLMTDKWLAAHQDATFLTEATREKGIPAYTLFLAELVRRAGGGIYFLRETQSGRDAFERIAGNIRTEYTLGFYPSGEGTARPGWHSLRVEVTDPGANEAARVANRSAYYVPAVPPR